MNFKGTAGLLSLTVIAVMLSNCAKPDYAAYYDSVVKELSSEDYNGRSVYGNGDIKAAHFIIGELEQIEGLEAAGTDFKKESYNTAFPEYKSIVTPGTPDRWNDEPENTVCFPYLQSFQFPMNVMRGDMSVEVDGKQLRATYDYTVKEFSPSCHGEFKVAYMPDDMVTEENFVKYLNSGEFEDSFVVVDWNRYLELPAPAFERYKPYIGMLDKVGGLIMKDSSLFPYFKARSYYTMPMPVLMVNGDFPSEATSIKVDIDAQMLNARDAHNVVAWLPGTDADNDEYVTFIAHYDHLGAMGADNVFPGANDNASGVAMLLALAKYYSANRPEFGIQFIFLDAEEANLLGAFYYCENPALPLEKTKVLINMDMVADSGDHLATEATENAMPWLEQFKAANADGQFAPFDVAMQDFSDNSDHYAFGLKGVPSIYFSTEGDYYQHYHTPRDTHENTTLENFDRLFSMIVKVVR